jgi:hypothetical protein
MLESGQVESGFAFWCKEYEKVPPHLFSVISDPKQDSSRILITNFTSWAANKEQTCVVESSEYSELTVKSCIDYRRTYLTSEADLLTRANYGRVRHALPVPPALLKRIREGAFISRFMLMGYTDLLKTQGFF